MICYMYLMEALLKCCCPRYDRVDARVVCVHTHTYSEDLFLHLYFLENLMYNTYVYPVSYEIHSLLVIGGGV